MRKRGYFDLDLTLYDTERMIEMIRNDMIELGSSKSEIDQINAELSAIGYTFEEHLSRLSYPPEIVRARADTYRRIQANGDRFLYPDVIHWVEKLKQLCECHLLTYGFPSYQQHKFEGIKALQPHFTRMHYVWRGQTKGDIVHGAQEEGVEDWVLDDSIVQLLDMQLKAPHARLVRMRRPHVITQDHPSDGVDWRVVSDLASFAHLMEAS